jgi:hypothetical protein
VTAVITASVGVLHVYTIPHFTLQSADTVADIVADTVAATAYHVLHAQGVFDLR